MWQLLFVMQKQYKIEKPSTSALNWRMDEQYYRPGSADGLRPGTLSLAPAWFEQGHTVCFSFALFQLVLTTIKEVHRPPPCVGRTMWCAAIQSVA